MCGIAGIMDWKNTLPSEERQGIVQAMSEAILHRGPDSAGFFSHHQATLAMRRLSIIDEQGGDQPIFNETRDVCIFFNGELYNFQSLKKVLLSQGHQFATNTDTEVLVHLYEEHGKAMLPKLKGMFAFCIYDLKKNQLLLARDRFGEKPLYYHFQNGVFSFASEINALLKNQYIPRQLNQSALPYYFRTSLVPEPITLLKNIKSLPAGHTLLVTSAGIQEEVYFQPSYQKKIILNSEEEAMEYISPILHRAVQRQMVSDVPIGAFLSGGIDSSSVVALLQKHSHQRIKTFNVRFEDQAYDESAIAKEVAAHCGTDHHEIFIPNVDFEPSIFWKIVDHVGLPFRDSSAIPAYFVSKAIAQHVKVALSGDGGDELFGGYDLFQWYLKMLNLKRVPKPILSLANQALVAAQRTPGFKNLSSVRKIKRGVHTSMADLLEMPIALNEMFSAAQVDHLVKPTVSSSDDLYPLLKKYPPEFHSWSPLRKIMYYRLIHTLPANMLIKVDRMSMANSLEVRAPFLDADLFDASVQIPDNLLVRGSQGKYLLRKIMRPFLPKSVFEHPKMGFNIPLYRYQNKAFKQLAQQLLFDENPMPHLIKKSTLTEIYQKGIALKRDNAKESVFQTSHQLWMMMMLFGWIKRFQIQN
ncbi:MAG: asparagine synthase (glutamine-hydrolyzing) [Bacteroidota bacterium]